MADTQISTFNLCIEPITLLLFGEDGSFSNESIKEQPCILLSDVFLFYRILESELSKRTNLLVRPLVSKSLDTSVCKDFIDITRTKTDFTELIEQKKTIHDENCLIPSKYKTLYQYALKLWDVPALRRKFIYGMKPPPDVDINYFALLRNGCDEDIWSKIYENAYKEIISTFNATQTANSIDEKTFIDCLDYSLSRYNDLRINDQTREFYYKVVNMTPEDEK